MALLISSVNKILFLLTVAGDILILGAVLTLIVYFVKKKQGRPFPFKNRLFGFLGKRAVLWAFIVALIATLGSLFYSEVAGYEPCKLCWFQRIFMYPQVVLLGMALFKKDKGILSYAVALSLPGLAVALSHYLLQTTGVSIFSCRAVGYSVSCAKIFVLNFGYITIPMMAATAFALIILFSLASRKSAR